MHTNKFFLLTIVCFSGVQGILSTVHARSIVFPEVEKGHAGNIPSIRQESAQELHTPIYRNRVIKHRKERTL